MGYSVQFFETLVEFYVIVCIMIEIQVQPCAKIEGRFRATIVRSY